MRMTLVASTYYVHNVKAHVRVTLHIVQIVLQVHRAIASSPYGSWWTVAVSVSGVRRETSQRPQQQPREDAVDRHQLSARLHQCQCHCQVGIHCVDRRREAEERNLVAQDRLPSRLHRLLRRSRKRLAVPLPVLQERRR